MVEGRCALSSYVTGAVAEHGRRVLAAVGTCAGSRAPTGVEARLTACSSTATPPTRRAATRRCARGASMVNGERDYAIEEPTSLNTLAILPS